MDPDSPENGPPFHFTVPSDYRHSNDFYLRDNLNGTATLTALRTFDRERQKEFLIPIIIRDSGHPVKSVTSTLTVTIGDQNDHEHMAGEKKIFINSHRGESSTSMVRFKDTEKEVKLRIIQALLILECLFFNFIKHILNFAKHVSTSVDKAHTSYLLLTCNMHHLYCVFHISTSFVTVIQNESHGAIVSVTKALIIALYDTLLITILFYFCILPVLHGS